MKYLANQRVVRFGTNWRRYAVHLSVNIVSEGVEHSGFSLLWHDVQYSLVQDKQFSSDVSVLHFREG